MIKKDLQGYGSPFQDQKKWRENSDSDFHLTLYIGIIYGSFLQVHISVVILYT